MDVRQEDRWLLVRKDGKVQAIISGMMFIGREECDVTLQSASADKRHAVLFFDGKNRELHIKDLNSLTGTYVNDIKIPEQTYMKLKPMDCLRFGYGPDVFRIQSPKQPSPLPSLPQKNNDKSISVIPSPTENREQSKNYSNPSVTSLKPQSLNVKKMSDLHDSLEDLKQQQSSITSEVPSKSLSPSGSDHPSVSPAFSSLTFKKGSSRSLCSPEEQNSINSSFSQENDSLPSNQSAKSHPNSSRPAFSPNAVCSPSEECSTQSEQQPQSEERDSPTESAPLAMAFTVAFDNPTPKKKFSIRDSISKYAPKKAESERALRQKTAKSSDTQVKKSPEPRPDTTQVELRKKKPAALSMENLTNECAYKKNSPTPPEISFEPKLSNGASYLIQKMFRIENPIKTDSPSLSPDVKRCALYHLSEVTNLPNHKSGSSPSKDGRPSGNEDAKSDTGTYTVEDDPSSKAVEEARQRIDEVFGIASMNAKSDSKLFEKSSHQLKSDESLKLDSISSNDTKEDRQPVIAPVRTKRRLPTPPVQTAVENSSQLTVEKPYLSAYGNYTAKGRPHTMLPVVPKESDKSVSCEKVSLSLPSKRLTLNNLELLQNSCGKSQLVTNGHPEFLRRTPPYGTRHRPSWNLSGSDLELDHLKIETSSVLSDISASTEPPMNPGSGKCDVGPQMKFNRAFALRRARLGLETELPPASRSLVSRDLKQSKEIPRSSPAAFSRQDGGRFSLRLPKSSSKTAVVNKVVSKSLAKSPIAPAAQKFGNNRMNNDLSKSAFLRKGTSQTQTASENTKLKSTAARSTFQRAASFSNNEERSPEPSLATSRGYQLRQQDRQSYVARQSTPRSSPVALLKDPNDGLCSKEGRVSAKPLEKNDLSALDSLVIQATHQLSAKLRNIAHHLLVKERDKFTEDSSERLMIDEVLPQMSENETSSCANCTERVVSQELANILKNLKRVEQSLKVLTVVIDEERMDHRRLHNHHHHMPETEESFYVVDM